MHSTEYEALRAREFLSRKEASAYLKARGLPVSPSTLNKYATVGGGPVHVKFGRLARYRPSDLDAWAAARLSAPRRSTSDRAGAPAPAEVTP